MVFDKIIHKTIDDETVDFGFVFGNNKMVFIKAGAGGGIPGYQEKYLRMAYRAHERLGATVICSSNYIKCLDLDRKAIEWCARYLKLKDAELYFVGTSDGADQCISLSRNAPTKKLLCINPSFVPGHDPSNRLILQSAVEKVFVYGTEDEEGRELIPKLKARGIRNLQIELINGADHSFTGMVDEFVSLIDIL
jgi:dienelactone hydrolase